MIQYKRYSTLYYLFILIFLMIIFAYARDRSTPLPIPQVKEPVFAGHEVNILDFGAKGDGETVNTTAINYAIQQCARDGGGRVIIPRGVWLTGPIDLASHIDLHLEKGALLLFSSDFDDYKLIASSFAGVNQVRCTSPVNAVNLENIAITGEGIIDGSGDAWRPVKRFKMPDRQWNELISSGGVVDERDGIWWPSREAMNGADYISSLGDSASLQDYAPARDFLRPVMIRLVNCKQVLLDGPVFQNSPAWNIHPLLCENVIIRNITVRNPWYSQNGDGLDLESCKNVMVTDCGFDVGDDAICLKSGKDEFGRKRGIPCENIMIRNCTVYSGHGGVSIGSEMSGGVRNVWVTDCTFMGTDVGVRFKSMRGRGGIVENLHFQRIRMVNIKNQAILFDLFYESDPDMGGEPVFNSGTPVFRDISFTDITSLNAQTAVFIRGLPESTIRDIQFENLLSSSRDGIQCTYAENIRFENLNMVTEHKPVIDIHQGRNILFSFIRDFQPQGTLIKVTGDQSRDIRIDAPGLKELLPEIDYGSDVHGDAVKVGLVE